MRGRGNPGEHFHGRRIVGHPRGNVRHSADDFRSRPPVEAFRRERRRVIVPPNRYNGGIPPISPYPHHRRRRGGCCGCFPILFLFLVIVACILGIIF